MSGMHSRDESSESHEERPTKRQKVTEFKKDDFENVSTAFLYPDINHLVHMVQY